MQTRIKVGTSATSERVYIELDTDLLHPVFAKKQDYEPMAVPAGFSVLDDLNKKIELKKIDQAISRSIENVVLLVTMGAEPDKGGVNHKNLAAMQQIFARVRTCLPDLNRFGGSSKIPSSLNFLMFE